MRQTRHSNASDELCLLFTELESIILQADGKEVGLKCGWSNASLLEGRQLLPVDIPLLEPTLGLQCTPPGIRYVSRPITDLLCWDCTKTQIQWELWPRLVCAYRPRFAFEQQIVRCLTHSRKFFFFNRKKAKNMMNCLDLVSQQFERFKLFFIHHSFSPSPLLCNIQMITLCHTTNCNHL